MLTVRHRIEIGSDTWSDTQNSRLTALRCHSDFRTPVNECVITMTHPVGINAAPGDPVTVKLGLDSELKTVFTGIVGSVESQVDHLVVRAVNTAYKLLAARLNLFFEKTSAGDIVKDLCGQLDVKTNSMDSGLDLSYYALGSNQSAAEHARYLAEICGFDLFSNEKGELNFKKTEGEEHAMEYSVNIISLQIDDLVPRISGIEVFGDSAASKQGTDAAYWLSKKPIKGKAGDDSEAQQTHFVGAARTEEHTQKIADAMLNARAGKKSGSFTTIGNSSIKLGDTIKVSEMPLGNQNGHYRVCGIKHLIDAKQGYVTILRIISTESELGLPSF